MEYLAASQNNDSQTSRYTEKDEPGEPPEQREHFFAKVYYLYFRNRRCELLIESLRVLANLGCKIIKSGHRLL